MSRAIQGRGDRYLITSMRLLAGIGALSASAAAFLVIDTAGFTIWFYEFDAFMVLFALFFAGFVWLVAPKQPHNPVVWTMTATALFGGVMLLGYIITWIVFDVDVAVAVAPIVPAELPPGAAGAIAWFGWMWVPAMLPVLTFGLLLFPDGKLPSPRWRWVAVTSSLGILLTGVGTAWSYRPTSTVQVEDGPLVYLGFVLVVCASVASVASLIGRFRRSTGDTRQQLKWVLFGVSFFIPVFMGLGFVIGGSDYEHLLRAPIMIAEAIFLTSYGIALAKYRLYDVDVVINRTLVLAVLAGFITLTYALVVVGVGQLVGGDEDGLALPIAATALVAVAFEPVRLRAQTWANRLVYGERATPYEVLSDLTARLAGAEEGQGILGRMATLILEGTGAERVTVWLGGTPGGIEPSATAGSDSSGLKEPELDADEVFPVHHDGEVVGVFEVVKPRGSSLSTAERSLIADLAGSAGAVLGYQRLNDSLAERARELDESRLRLLEAQDEERRRLERDLHDGAQQMLVGLKVKIGVAAQLAERHGADQLVALLRGLSAEAQAALDEVRLLARGIYPPVLESDGLGSAISALAASAPIEVSVSEDGLGRYPMEVEAAVYFDVSEAVTNAVKHARTPVRIDLLDDGERLRFTVSDTGPGFDTRSSTAGSGLVNMADRLDSVGGSLVIESGSEGTRVRGVVPLSVARSPQPESTQVSASRVGSNSDLERKATAPASRALDSYSPAS